MQMQKLATSELAFMVIFRCASFQSVSESVIYVCFSDFLNQVLKVMSVMQEMHVMQVMLVMQGMQVM